MRTRAKPCVCRGHGELGYLFCRTMHCWCHAVIPKNVLLLPAGADGVHRVAWDAHGSGGRVFVKPTEPPFK